MERIRLKFHNTIKMKNYIIRRTKFIHNHLTILHPWNSEVLGYENAIFGMG